MEKKEKPMFLQRMMSSFRKSKGSSRAFSSKTKSTLTSERRSKQEFDQDLDPGSPFQDPDPGSPFQDPDPGSPLEDPIPYDSGCCLHKNQPEIAFCLKCVSFLCSNCQNDSNHEQCGPILTLDEAISSHFLQTRLSEVKNVRKRIMDLRLELYDYINHLEVARRQHWRDAWTARRTIIDLASQQISSVENKRDALLIELDSCEENLIECLDSYLNQSKDLLERQSKALSEIDQLLSTPFNKKFMNLYQNHTENHTKIDEVCLNSKECIEAVNTTIRFTPETLFPDTTNRTQTNNLGVVHQQPPPGLTNTIYENTFGKRWFTHFSKIGDFFLYLHPPPVSPRLLSNTLSRGTTKAAYLRDIIALPDNQYIVIDGGEVVNRYSEDGFTTGKMQLLQNDVESLGTGESGNEDSNQIEIRACCGCRWSKERVALTLPNGEIRIVNMASDMTIECKGKLKKKYWGVAKVNERTLACVACSSPTIDLIRVDEEPFRVAKSFSCEFGQNTTRARYIAITPDLCLVVTDGDIIQGLDFQGNTKFLITTIAHPAGVTADSTYIYVCDRALSRILRLTTKGEVDCVLLTKEDGLSNPEAIDVTNNGRLLVTKWRGGRVLTFDLNEIMV